MDPVDDILKSQLPACRAWLREGRDFVVTFVTRSSDCGGHWCTWVRLSPPPIGPELGIVQVLIDSDAGGFDTTLVVGRPIGNRPGSTFLTMVVDHDDKPYLLPDPDPIEYLGAYPRILRRGPAERKPARRYSGEGHGMAEWCARFNGAFLRREEDGIWSFLIPL